MKMLKVIWIDKDKEIPKYGYAYQNKTKTFPVNIAKSFISQGKAKLYKK